jgi:group II intron reverse transcriptase/maturase
MNERDESDSSVVPQKRANNAASAVAESVEGRGLAKGNPREQNGSRTQGRNDATNALERIREAAKRDRKLKFTALLHHVYDIDRLRVAYGALKPSASAGVDGVTWHGYGQDLEKHLRDLSERLKRGAYRAQPVRRAYIPKADGQQRPIGVPTLEDKIVQRAVTEVLSAIYEQDFVNFSYGFRPGRDAHQAVDAVWLGICKRKVGWVLDADIRSFFDTIEHEWLVKFIEHRVGDKRVIRLIQKWLKAGVLEDGERVVSEEGAVQGGSISPLLANIYLHYVFDLWTDRYRKREVRGDMIVVRFADDFVAGFQHKEQAEQYLSRLRERFGHFGLELHVDKSRLIEFGRFAAQNRAERGERKPETFNFLGFTHICAVTRRGWFTVLRKTNRQRMQRKLREVSAELRRRMHESVVQQGRYLGAVVRGHARYYGVPGNSIAIGAFRTAIAYLWLRLLRRRSHKHRMPWVRMNRLVTSWLPIARISHPYPNRRFGVRHPRQEPSAVVPHAGIRAGGGPIPIG